MFYLADKTEDLSPGHSLSDIWETGPRREGRGLDIQDFLQQRPGSQNIKRLLLIKENQKWQPTPVFLPGESQGRGSLVGCRLWGRTESDTTEVT